MFYVETDIKYLLLSVEAMDCMPLFTSLSSSDYFRSMISVRVFEVEFPLHVSLIMLV